MHHIYEKLNPYTNGFKLGNATKDGVMRCKIEFEFIGALISHLERHHTLDRHREVEASETSAKTRKWDAHYLPSLIVEN